MSDDTIQLLLDKKIPIVTTFAPLVMQSEPEMARQYNIPEWKIAERQKAVADPSRYQGLVNAAKAGVVDRLWHRRRQPGGGARRDRAGTGVHGQARRQARQL